LTFAGAVAEISRAAGREIRYVPVSIEEYAAGAAEHGVPEEFVGFLTYLFEEVLGRNAYPTDGVQRAVGRKPRDFAEYARRRCHRGLERSGFLSGRGVGLRRGSERLGVHGKPCAQAPRSTPFGPRLRGRAGHPRPLLVGQRFE
jgi:hypothetical protein